MNEGKVLADEIFKSFTYLDDEAISTQLEKALKNFNKKIIVLDDDPTGIQTVYGISVYTDYSVESIESGFSESNAMFFILTNSRSFVAEKTEKVHREIALNIIKVSEKFKKDFIIISRGDSTLRGNYPLETQVLKDTLEENSHIRIDGEVVFPFFKEGGRFTVYDTHYVQENEFLTPVGETEYARDKTFGYINSHLGRYIEEKTISRYKAENVQYISLEDIRCMNIEGIFSQLLTVDGFNKVVVNALEYVDVKVFTVALLKAMKSGKRFLFRTAASFTKVFGGVPDRGLLTRQELISDKNNTGGLIVVGSHVKKTSEQLQELKEYSAVTMIEFNQHLVLKPSELENEVDRVVKTCEKLIKSGKTVVIYTKRERLDLDAKNSEEELKIAVKISDAVTSIVQKLSVCPSFIVAKGGITSSDIGTKGLKVKKAIVAGQIKPGIPVWITGEESKFPCIPYIIFPGNVGTKSTLKEIIEMLIKK